MDTPSSNPPTTAIGSVLKVSINYFITAALIFLGASLILYVLTGLMMYRLSLEEPNIMVPELEAPSPGGELSQRDIYNFYGRVLSFMLAPMVTMLAGVICTLVGIRLLRSSGVVAAQVIAPQDYPVLGPAISAGNEQAITKFIRLSSLSGITGTFTKIGLANLPLATIFLTIFLALLGIVNSQFFDLAKLTLGAFLGSFVQRQYEVNRSTAATTPN